MQVTTLGIDIGKTVFHLVGLNATGQVILRRKVSRAQLFRVTADLQPCRIGMEACGSAHHLARGLREQGHDTRIIPAQYVRPFVKTNKNDTVDAEAIAEAVLRPTMRFVPIKSEEQQDLQAIHRHRQRLIGRRTALVNQIRGMLYERGITAPQTTSALAKKLAEALAVDGDHGLTTLLRELLQEMREEWLWLDARLSAIDDKLRYLCRQSEMTRRLVAVPGIGVITATALVAAVSDGSGFSRGRDLAAWMGLVPRQHSTGGRARLGGISKRGNSYLRMLFIHCARALLRVLDRKGPPLGQWAARLEERAHRNVVIVALANKLARVAWAVLRPGAGFDRGLMAI
jgi:transposase